MFCRTFSATRRHITADGDMTLCGFHVSLIHNADSKAEESWMIIDLPPCASCERSKAPKEPKMTKLTATQSDALSYVGFAKGYPVAPRGFTASTWNSLEKRGLVSVTRGPNKRDITGVGLTDAGRAYLTEEPAAVEKVWPEADGSVLRLADMSDQQAEALTDVKTVGWTPAAVSTVESLLRYGLIVWVPATTDPAEFKLTEEGARAYKAISVFSVVPNRADRRRLARSLKTIRPAAPRTRKTPATRDPKSLKPGEVYVTESGEKVTVGWVAKLRGRGVYDQTGMFRPIVGRVTMAADSPRVRLSKGAGLRVGDRTPDGRITGLGTVPGMRSEPPFRVAQVTEVEYDGRTVHLPPRARVAVFA